MMQVSTPTATRPEWSHSSDVQHPRRLSWLAGLAIVGLVILNASAWLLPLVSEYSAIGDNISELVLGRLGFVQTAAFVLAGLGILGLAFAIRQLTRGAWGSLAGSLLIAIYGAGAIVVAIFPTDRIDTADDVWSQSTTGTIHVVAALIAFLCGVAAMFILTHWTFRREAPWRSRWHWWLALFPAAALTLLLAQSEGPWVGLMQRLLVGVISAWLILIALQVRAIAGDAEAGRLRTVHESEPALTRR